MSKENNRVRIGSLAAKGGFLNEKVICDMFNNWRDSDLPKQWLSHMGYDISKIEKVIAIQIPTRISKTDALNIYNISNSEFEDIIKYKKADAQIKIFVTYNSIIKIENISLKKANSNANFNQIDKRKVDTYQKMWGFDDEIANWLKYFTGEIIPNKKLFSSDTVLKEINKRIFIDEFPKRIIGKLLDFINNNKILIISDIIKGRGTLSADWILVTKFEVNLKSYSWILVDINLAMNYFGSGDIKISPKGSLNIGKITMQRKGGTPDPTSLQFKINPCGLFELENF